MISPKLLAVHQPQADEAVLELGLPTDHPAFAGHFPDQPILPGVVQVDWAVRLAAELLGTERLAATDLQVKFRRVIQPLKPLSLTLRVDRSKGTLSFEYRCDGEIASTGRIKLEEAS